MTAAKTITPLWWKCDTHGPAKANAWGCPECVREMRGELKALRDVVEQILDAGHMNTEDLARLRAAWENA
jgi:hypothetical protein